MVCELATVLSSEKVDPTVIKYVTDQLQLQYVSDFANYWTAEEVDSSALQIDIVNNVAMMQTSYRLQVARLRTAWKNAQRLGAVQGITVASAAPRRKQFVFASGASGAGKTTICNVLTENGYKVFDGDIWCAGGDPVNQVDAPVTAEMVASRDPAMAKAVTDAISIGRTKMGKGEQVPWEVWESFYTFMCEAIKTQTDQNGYDKWVIPFAVYREAERDFVRKMLGGAGDVTFILLNVPEAVLAERVYNRTVNKAKEQGMTLEQYFARFHPGKTIQQVLETWKIRRSGFQPKGTNEPSTFQIDVTREMTPQMVHAEAERQLGFSKGEPVWYFATGSMMNPALIEGRNLKPIKSLPAQLLDYKLRFLGRSGFAANVPEKGASTHGVLHLMAPESMEKINEEERGYDRIAGMAKAYDGSVISCTVYVVNLQNLSPQEAENIAHSNPPAERYIDRLVEGARHYGCAADFITWLRAQPCVPRKTVGQLVSLNSDSVSATWSLQDLERHKNPKEGMEWCIGLNGKVLQYIGPKDGKARKRLLEWSGEDVTLRLAKEMYDPKYGMPQTAADISLELALMQEDKLITAYGGMQNFEKSFHLVARLQN